MKHRLEIVCLHCQNNDLIKNGKSANGAQKTDKFMIMLQECI
jgi:hypothetical protein